MKTASPPGIISYLLPGTRDALFISLLLVVCIRGSDLFNADSDLGRHITIGKHILQEGIPYSDVFSHTLSGHYLVSHEWLAQVAFSAFHSLLGLGGPVLLTAILISATFALTYNETLRRKLHHLPALLFTVLAAFTSIIHWLARPHILTFTFTALWTFGLQRVADRTRMRLWLFPLLMLVWANTHGAFISGFVTLFAFLAGWLWEYISGEADASTGKNLALIGLTSFAATFVNPYGWHLWDTSAGYFGNRFLVDYTIEYQSPNFHEFSGLPFLLMLSLGFIAPVLGRKPRPHEVFLFAGWSALGLYSERNIPLFAIVAAPYLALMFQPLFDKFSFSNRMEISISRMENQLQGKGIALPIVSSLFLMLAIKQGFPLDSAGLGYRYDPTRFPVRAAEWLEANPQTGNMLNHFNWGGFLLYSLNGSQPVFIDGQTDFYGETLTLEYVTATTLGAGWQEVITKYDVGWAIVRSKEDAEFVEALQREMGWQIRYEDDVAVIIHRP